MLNTKTQLIGLQADKFRHPLDLEATTSLRRLPGLDLLVRNLLGGVTEEFLYLNNIAASVLIGEHQLPHIHKLLVEACGILDLEVPQLYLKQHPAPNAYTMAVRGKKPFIVVHTSLVDLLTPAELQAVIAHELGHLKCEHGVYLTLANIIVLATGGLLPGVGNAIAQNLQAQMLQWLRCAEFSCDRAALLVSQDPKTVISVLMKLSGGSPLLAPLLNVDAFLDQARAYEAIGTTSFGKMLTASQTEQLSHPVPVLRAKEIDAWSQTDNYQSLLNNPTMRYDKQAINKGGWRNW
ncbi:M48 family metallopeptidase [Chamaesiphon sp. GL140_3_metabinner_50]|uniref:M48 family metallopeptidase n=1 Tax=Chamaesiphon sp. GL140_3_metabinner_50 TaxID=2970812 RepID=UPI0025E8AF38|nr:M48 family metallopeptidase [Chamaesiphon sp. GL140_3_metabinner_50]